MVLTTILPGLRDLRTPLATGYMWLVAMYLVFAELLNEGRQRLSFLGEQITTLAGVLGTTTVLGVVTFIAYLIGTSTAIDRISLQPEKRFVTAKWSPIKRLHRHVIANATTNYKQVDQKYNDTVFNLVDKPWTSSRMDIRLFFQAVDPKKEVWDFDKEIDFAEDTEDDVISFVKQAIDEETGVIEQTIHNEKLVTWDDYDREHAEAVWRLSILSPLLVIITAAIVRYLVATWLSPWALLAIPMILVGLGFVYNLYARGYIKAASAESILRMAVVLNPEVSPSLARLKAYSRAHP